MEGQIADLTVQRDALALQIKAALNGAEFNGKATGDAQAQSLIAQAQSLLDQAHALAQ